MDALAQMVKDPPLAAGVPATPENMQTWKTWWAKRRVSTDFVRRVPQSFE